MSTDNERVEYVEVRRDRSVGESIEKLHSNLILPSYSHGYSLAIEFMHKWFLSKFDKNFFVGGTYLDGKYVLDDYKNLIKNPKNIVKGQNPRLRMEARVEFDYDREGIDTYMAPPSVYLRRSVYNEAFFKDYDRKLFLALQMRALRMTFNFKVRVNTRAQQLDLYNKMNMNFRIGSTMQENISVDFHVPKVVMLDIADKAGFEIKNKEIVDIVDFLAYMNQHSDLPFLFKIRAINQKAEFFIRFKDLYTHISCLDKLQMDDGERDGKLDFNFHIEMSSILTIPIPQFYAYYSAHELTSNVEVELDSTTTAIYSIAVFDIPDVDENGWNKAAITDYMIEDNDTEMDLSSLFTGDNILARAINHDLNRGVSPYHFINIAVYKDSDLAKCTNISMDWNTKIATFDSLQAEDILHIAVYYDREYINELEIEKEKYNSSRINF